MVGHPRFNLVKFNNLHRLFIAFAQTSISTIFWGSVPRPHWGTGEWHSPSQDPSPSISHLPPTLGHPTFQNTSPLPYHSSQSTAFCSISRRKAVIYVSGERMSRIVSDLSGVT